MPVEQAYCIRFGPVAVAVASLYVEAAFRMSSRMAVGAPFGVEEVGVLGHRSFFHFPIVSEAPAVPTCPDGGRIDIDNVGTEVAPSDDGLTCGVELVSHGVKRCHQPTNGSAVENT